MARGKGAFKLPKNKCRKKLAPLSRAAKGSFRWKKVSKSTYLLIACPRGKYNAKTEKCRVGTFAVEEIKTSRKGSACPTGFRKR